MNVRCAAFAHILFMSDVSMCSDFLSKNEDAAAKAAVAADKAAEQAKSQIVAKSKMSKAEKSQQKKEKVRMQAQHHFYRLFSLIPRDFARRPRHSIPLQPQKRRSDAQSTRGLSGGGKFVLSSQSRIELSVEQRCALQQRH